VDSRAACRHAGLYRRDRLVVSRIWSYIFDAAMWLGRQPTSENVIETVRNLLGESRLAMGRVVPLTSWCPWSRAAIGC
jgi:hypothetical protein